MEPGGQQRPLPHALLPSVPHHQQVIPLKGQLLFHLILLILVTALAQGLGEEGAWFRAEIQDRKK